MHDEPTPNPSPSPRSRPLSVWIISTWYFLSGLFSINMIAMLRSRLESAGGVAEGVVMPMKVSSSDLHLAALLIAVNLTGAGFLFLLKRAAVNFFRGAVVLNVGINAWYLVTEGPGDQPVTMLLGLAIGLFISVAVARHAQQLERTGVLR